MTHTLHLGDCLEVLPTLADKSVDAIICDPPYGTTACKWDSVIPLDAMWKECKRVIKDRGAIVLFGSQPFTSALIMSNPKWFRYQWVWEKPAPVGFQMANYRPMKKHEDIAVFSSAPATATTNKNSMLYHPQGVCDFSRRKRRPGKHDAALSGGKTVNDYISEKTGYPHSILKFSEPYKNRLHPTQKPVALLEYLVKTYTNEGDTVLDFTMGSGTTGVACINTNRHFIGIEKDATYFEIAKNRIEQTMPLFAEVSA